MVLWLTMAPSVLSVDPDTASDVLAAGAVGVMIVAGILLYRKLQRAGRDAGA